MRSISNSQAQFMVILPVVRGTVHTQVSAPAKPRSVIIMIPFLLNLNNGIARQEVSLESLLKSNVLNQHPFNDY